MLAAELRALRDAAPPDLKAHIEKYYQEDLHLEDYREIGMRWRDRYMLPENAAKLLSDEDKMRIRDIRTTWIKPRPHAAYAARMPKPVPQTIDSRLDSSKQPKHVQLDQILPEERELCITGENYDLAAMRTLQQRPEMEGVDLQSLSLINMIFRDDVDQRQEQRAREEQLRGETFSALKLVHEHDREDLEEYVREADLAHVRSSMVLRLHGTVDNGWMDVAGIEELMSHAVAAINNRAPRMYHRAAYLAAPFSGLVGNSSAEAANATAGLARYLKPSIPPDHLFLCETIFVPWLDGYRHWSLMVIDVKERVILVYESRRAPMTAEAKLLVDWLQAYYGGEQWKVEAVDNLIQSPNRPAGDCGPIVALTAFLHAAGKKHSKYRGVLEGAMAQGVRNWLMMVMREGPTAELLARLQ